MHPGSTFPRLNFAPPQTFPRLAARVSLIAHSTLFAGMSAMEHNLLAQAARIRTFSRHECLFEQDAPVRSVYLLESGSVKLTQLNHNGSEVILWLLGPGRAVGVFGMPSHALHTCSAWTITDSKVLSWDWGRLDSHMRGQQMRNNLGVITTQCMIELEQRFREVATQKVSVRAASALVRVIKQVGRETRDGYEVLLSREEIAQLTGTTLFTISRLVSKWSQAGLVTARREAIVVLDPQRLLAFASGEE